MKKVKKTPRKISKPPVAPLNITPEPKQPERIIKNSVLICCPVYGDPKRENALSYAAALSNRETALVIGYRDEPKVAMVHKARNNLAAHFLTTPYEWMLMTDSDMEYSIKDIERLVLRGKPVIGGLYRQRALINPPIYVLNTWDNKPFDPKAGEVQKVRYLGTGFLLIHRSVFLRMIEKYPEIAYTSDQNEGLKPRWDFFTSGIFVDETSPIPRRYLSGDWYFCQRWNDLGGEVYVDCQRSLPHHGSMAF